MSAGQLDCPRCDGRRLVRTTRYEVGEDGHLAEVALDAICPICSGSGTASLWEPIGQLAGPAALVRDAA